MEQEQLENEQEEEEEKRWVLITSDRVTFLRVVAQRIEIALGAGAVHTKTCAAQGRELADVLAAGVDGKPFLAAVLYLFSFLFFSFPFFSSFLFIFIYSPSMSLCLRPPLLLYAPSRFYDTAYIPQQPRPPTQFHRIVVRELVESVSQLRPDRGMPNGGRTCPKKVIDARRASPPHPSLPPETCSPCRCSDTC